MVSLKFDKQWSHPNISSRLVNFAGNSEFRIFRPNIPPPEMVVLRSPSSSYLLDIKTPSCAKKLAKTDF